jgi:hypothetical protein
MQQSFVSLHVFIKFLQLFPLFVTFFTHFEFIDESDITENEKKHWMFQKRIYGSLTDAYKDYILDWTKPEVIAKYKNTNPGQIVYIKFFIFFFKLFKLIISNF